MTQIFFLTPVGVSNWPLLQFSFTKSMVVDPEGSTSCTTNNVIVIPFLPFATMDDDGEEVLVDVVSTIPP